VNIGTAIASAAVLVSAVAIIYTWRQDRRTRVRIVTDAVRLGAAKMLAKLSRWQDLATWFYFAINPTLVEAAEKLSCGEAREKVRDWTWKTLPAIRADLLGRINDENLETVAPELCAYDVGTLTHFMLLVTEMKTAERTVFEHFMARSQDTILDGADKKAVSMGNRLREKAELDRQRLADQLARRSSEFIDYLTTLISSSDDAIMKKQVTVKRN
jgi:hypothetical protein